MRGINLEGANQEKSDFCSEKLRAYFESTSRFLETLSCACRETKEEEQDNG
jgi:hypothetical protein